MHARACVIHAFPKMAMNDSHTQKNNTIKHLQRTEFSSAHKAQYIIMNLHKKEFECDARIECTLHELKYIDGVLLDEDELRIFQQIRSEIIFLKM
jgi:hypothetical protein